MTETIYNYHSLTGEYTDSAPADESPLESSVILLPAFSTTVKPPMTGDREVAVFAEGQWQVKADWRGAALYSTTDGSTVSISEIGKTPADAGATDKPMPSASHSWKDGAWGPDPVKIAEQLEATKIKANARIAAYAQDKRQLIAGTSDAIEIAGWPNKLRIAQAIKSGSATDAEITAFKAEIAARGISGETLDAFVQRVLNNATFYAQAVALIDGLKCRSLDAVASAKTADEVDAVLAAMRAQAEAAFTKLMGGA